MKGKQIFKVLPLLFTVLLAEKSHAQPGNLKKEWNAPQKLSHLLAAPAALIPFPQQVEWTRERFVLHPNIILVCANRDKEIAATAIRSLKELFADNGYTIKVADISTENHEFSNSIQLICRSDLPIRNEGYLLRITNATVSITAKDAAGLFYGVQTVRQLILKERNIRFLPGCSITDFPAFSIRGFMHDNGRNYQGIDQLKKQIDILSRYKFNTFHWHLTDNPAWRPESKIYPQLNKPANRNPNRDPDSSYTFDNIRELIRFSRERNITIIPELDMPGHSKYFEPTFGFKMETQQGMKVLEELIDEFCKEIPASDCPIIHIGSDEVRIANPEEFIARMTARIRANGRKVMGWNPGLPYEPGTIEQIWRDDATVGERISNNPYVDSYGGYLNYFDAYTLVQRYFFQQVCNKPIGDSVALGGIVCCWPDVRVDDKSKISLHNPVWPGALAYSESVWCGRSDYNPDYMSVLPAKGTPAINHFREFESRLACHRDNYFMQEHFPYVQFGNSEWILTGPFPRNAKKINVTGGVIHINDWLKIDPLNNDVNETAYLTTYIKSDKEKNIYAIIGFETAARSNRRSAGIPANGKWDANGGAVFINGSELKGPNWKNPGGNRYLHATWERPANEIPFTDEEFYWSREPAQLQLKKGWNKISVTVPRTYRDQNWQFAFVPVKIRNNKWVEDLSIECRSSR